MRCQELSDKSLIDEKLRDEDKNILEDVIDCKHVDSDFPAAD